MIVKAFSSLLFSDFSKQKGGFSMFLTIQCGGYQIGEYQKQNSPYMSICHYDDMTSFAETYDISPHILQEARKFGFAKYESFEAFDCMSLEMLDFANVLLTHGSVVIYLEKNRACFFTSKTELVTQTLQDCAKALGERITFSRMLYLFLEAQTKQEHIAFDAIEKEILGLEQALITAQKKSFVTEIIGLRKKLMMMKRYYEQFLDVLDIIIENENDIFDEKTLGSFKRLSKKTERSYQNILNLREAVTQVRESYEAEVDIRLNTTMKVFTVVTTIFLPLTVIAGWYGMNFQMPEYGWEHGYLIVILVSVAFVVAGIAFFKKNKWF